jgi:hypothetical protein
MTMARFFQHAAIAALLGSTCLTGPATAQDAMQGGYMVRENAVAGAVREFNRDHAATTDQRVHPRFKVQIVNFHANDETGIDALGADEIFVVIETAAHHMATRTIEGVDTDETVRISPRFNCIYPAVDPDRQYNHQWRCLADGAPGDISFRISLYETDGQTPFSWGACALGGQTDLLPLNEAVYCTAESHSRVFDHRRSFTAAALAAMLPAPYAHEDFTIDGSQYSVTYRVTRMTDLVTQEERVFER